MAAQSLRAARAGIGLADVSRAGSLRTLAVGNGEGVGMRLMGGA
ncbi:hypothetical protein ACSFBX_20695 [Variovorax sp. RB2P76]